MARTPELRPDVPLTYRGIEVCDHIAWHWDTHAGSLWRMGVNQMIDSVTAEINDLHTYIHSAFGMSDYQDGREMAADMFVETLDNYKKD